MVKILQPYALLYILGNIVNWDVRLEEGFYKQFMKLKPWVQAKFKLCQNL